MQALLHAATGVNLVEISREIAVIFFAFKSPTGWHVLKLTVYTF